MDEYADSMACFAATHFHIKRKEREKRDDDTNEENNNTNNNENTNDNENNDTERYERKRRRGRGRGRGRYGDRERDNKRWKEDKDKVRAEKQKRKTFDYHDAYYYCWDVIVRSIALFDSFPLSNPPLSRLNRYLTTLLHRHLAKRITTYRLLKYSTNDRWQIAFCGVAKKQNEEEDQVIDVDGTRDRQHDLYFMYSVNGGAETKKLLRDPLNLEPMWVIECLLEGKFNEVKVTKALDYMLQNGIHNYRESARKSF
jgi:hypothetical protein